MLLERDDFTLTDELALLDSAEVAALLRQAYWAETRSTERIAESMRHSLCFGLRKGGRLVGFVRVLTDYAVNSYICDFIIEPALRGSGLGTWMMEALLAHPLVARTQKLLLTRDAQEFYGGFGFQKHPLECMRADGRFTL